MSRTSEAAFETVIEAHLLANGYGRVGGDGFDRNRAIFPEVVLDFCGGTQPKEWARRPTPRALGMPPGAGFATKCVSR